MYIVDLKDRFDMKEFVINELEAGQRFDKYLVKRLPNASKSFLYKMLRKKNITLNKKKADGSEKIQAGDCIQIFFSDETFDKFTADSKENTVSQIKTADKKALKQTLEILYEDSDILAVNKPTGMLSQKAEKNDVSLVEYITDYLLESGFLTNTDLQTFKPGVCNRLDRNTSGIVMAGKTVKGLQEMTAAFKERTLHKYYICVVKGCVQKRSRIKGYLYKNERTNKVTILSENESNIPENALPIETEYIPVCSNDKVTFLKVNLITGRSHQIRAHLAYLGHPLAGDVKYGNASFNGFLKKNFNIESQMLHAYQLDMPQRELVITTKLPEEFITVLKGEGLWQRGIQEDLEALR